MPSLHLSPQTRSYCFNIDHAVGKGKPNHRLDVMLIQYLLRFVYAGKKIDPAYYKNFLLDMDGACGPSTLTAITAYQTENSKASATLTGQPPLKAGLSPTSLNPVGTIFAHISGVEIDGSIDPWKFPAEMHTARVGNIREALKLKPSLTLLLLCAEFQQADESRSMMGMPTPLRKLFLTK